MTLSLDYALSLRSLGFQFNECVRACCENQLSHFLQGVFVSWQRAVNYTMSGPRAVSVEPLCPSCENHPALCPASTGDHLLALPVGGAPAGSGGGGPAVDGDRSFVLGRHGGPHVPDACADPVWETLL